MIVNQNRKLSLSWYTMTIFLIVVYAIIYTLFFPFIDALFLSTHPALELQYTMQSHRFDFNKLPDSNMP